MFSSAASMTYPVVSTAVTVGGPLLYTVVGTVRLMANVGSRKTVQISSKGNGDEEEDINVVEREVTEGEWNELDLAIRSTLESGEAVDLVRVSSSKERAEKASPDDESWVVLDEANKG